MDAAAATIHLQCRVGGQVAAAAPGFSEGVCPWLADTLARDLGIRVVPVAGSGWPADGRAVSVDIEVTGAHAAAVSIRTGQVSDGRFAGGAPDRSTLTSYDRPLSVGAARALVRGIGLSLGVIR